MAVEKVKERAEESIKRASREQQKPTGKNTRERTKTTEKCKYVKGRSTVSCVKPTLVNTAA